MIPGCNVRIRRGERVFHVHGDRAGAEGVYLAEGQAEGLLSKSPRKSTWKGGAFQVGSRLKGTKRPHKDWLLGFHVRDTEYAWEFNDSEFFQVFQYEPDEWDEDQTPTLIEVDSELSGTRVIDVLMYEEPTFNPGTDPFLQQYGNVIMKLRSGQPDWWSENYVDEWSSGATSATGSIMVANPTDLPAYHYMVLTPANWSIPDPSWVGPPSNRRPGGVYADRMVDGINITAVNGGARVHWDRGTELMFRDLNGTNIQGQLGNRFVMHRIPPRTAPTSLPISYTDAPAGGAMARVVVPQRWSAPYGLESRDVSDWEPPLGITRFQVPGSWEYLIPDNATHIDVVMLGGGGGGGASGLIPEDGGSAGVWFAKTLVRGKDIPAGTRKMGGQVGAGGAGGKHDNTLPLDIGTDGEASTCVADGMSTLTSAGGKASGHAYHPSGDDCGPELFAFNGIEYRGGGTQTDLSSAGKIPGGGGSAGLMFRSGGSGARGQVWVRAYRL